MDKKITIGLFNDSFFPMMDGVVSVVDSYARRLSKYANVIVFVPKYSGRDYNDDMFPYKVVRCRSVKISFLDYSLAIPTFDRKFMKELNSYNLDIVHIHSPFAMGEVGIKYAKKRNIPCVATMHSLFLQDFQKAVKNKKIANELNYKLIKNFEKCTECWTVTEEVARIYHEEYHYKCLPRVVENATDMLPLNDEKKAINLINKKYNIKKNEKVFLFVGRINTLKNIIFIADAISLLKGMNPNFKFKMLYVGDGRDKDVLKRHIKELGIEKDVILCGGVYNRYELACYYKRADLFLFPSLYDTFSLVRVEAASQKTPSIVLRDSAIGVTIKDNVNGFLTDYSVNSFAKKIMEVMNDKELYDKVCEGAFRDLYKYWDDTVDYAYQLYLELIDKHNQKR